MLPSDSALDNRGWSYEKADSRNDRAVEIDAAPGVLSPA